MAKDFRMWVYHKTEQPKIICSSEYENHKTDGWMDSPASFITYESMGLDVDKLKEGDINEAMKGQQIQDSIKGVVESTNGMLNLDKMKKTELKGFAKKHAGIQIKSKEKKPEIISKIKQELE